jgi:hypothetical protein
MSLGAYRFIDLYFDDQSHFGLSQNVPFTWQKNENEAFFKATKRKYQKVVELMTLKKALRWNT